MALTIVATIADPKVRHRMRKPTKRRTAASHAEPATPDAGGADKKPSERVPKKAERSQELSFKVTDGFRQRFKQTAKELGIKKTALLERLLADWQERHAASGRAKPPPSTAGEAAPRTAGKPARKAKPATGDKAKPARA